MRKHKLIFQLSAAWFLIYVLNFKLKGGNNNVKKIKISAICILLITTILCSFLILPVSAATEADAKALAKIDSVLLEKMETSTPDEKIPVAIWYSDIDQEKVDKLTVDKVGYTQEEISLTYEMPSTELINNLEKGKEDAVGEMQAYLKRTEAKREKERKRTNEYIMTHREFSRIQYNEKSARIIKDISLEENDITFKSQYAPMIIAELTSAQIIEYCKKSNIESVYYHTDESVVQSDESETIFDNIDIAKTRLKYSDTLSKLNLFNSTLNGNGVLIGVSESGGQFNNIPELQGTSVEPLNGVTYNGNGNHITDVVCLIVGKNSGFAPNASVITSNTDKDMIETLISRNVQVFNMSFSVGNGDVYYCSNCKYFDHIVSYHHITVVAAVHNNSSSGKIFAPALGYNVIGVGAYHLGDQSTIFTPEFEDDKMTQLSGYINTDCAEKPDVVLPGGSTSYATPILTSCIALMLQLKPSLASYPQVVKAIVLASCHDKVLSSDNGEPTETIHSGITEKQGAGAFDLWSMFSIVSQGTYGVGRLSASKDQAVRRFVMPKYKSNSYMNISLTWIKQNYIKDEESDHITDNIEAGPDVNLDLYIYRNGQQVGSSTIGTTNTKKSSTEMTYIALDDSNWDYEIRINDVDSYNGVIRYGYAYSTSDSYITPATEEGVYYIRNYASDKYLTLNTSTSETEMSNFTGANNQQWVLKGTTDDYEIYPAHYSASKKINFGSQVGSNPYYKSVLGTSDLNLSLKSWESDTTLEPDAYVFTSISGGSNNIMSYTSLTGVFVRSATESVINIYRMWVLEDINYQNGDVNMDGDIDITDATEIEKGLANTITLSNAQRLLGDANYDGRVSIQDATYIRKLTANIN